MKLKHVGPSGASALDWIANLGREKIIAVQGTAVYDPRMLRYMSAAAQDHDCVGVGIARKTFDANDPFGTFVEIEKDGARETRIIEQDIRNDDTRKIIDPKTNEHLPFNTGLYAFDRKLLERNDLDDYATPPKEILPNLPKSQKIGYAATDLLPLAKNPLVLTVEQSMYAVIKNAADLDTLSDTAAKFFDY